MRAREQFWVWACALGLSLATPTFANWIPISTLGTTGWEVDVDDQATNWAGVVDWTRPTADTVYIEIDKAFYDSISDGVFSPIRIRFVKTNPQTTVNRIVITDEVIYNGTGTTWTDFHFFLEPVEGDGPIRTVSFGGSATPVALRFDSNATAFSTVTFSGNDGYLDGPLAINFKDGSVAADDSFRVSPTGPDVVIRTAPTATEFVLREVPTPEPGTIVLVMGGVAAMFTGRRRSLRTLGIIAVCAGVLGFAGVHPAQASLMALGNSGWSADAAAGVTVSLVGVSEGTVSINVTKEFSGAPTGSSWTPLQIIFKKTSTTAAANRIVIANETVTNHTTSDWNEFHMYLMTPGNSKFDVSVLPAKDHFADVSFPDALHLDFQNGWVLKNDSFTTQNINIDVTGFLPNRIFYLKEWPEVPEPTSLLLLAAGLAAGARRGRIA